MDYLNLDKDIFFSMVNMKLRDFYSDLEDLCLSENIDQKAMNKKIESSGFIYDKDLNRLKVK